MRRHLVRRGLIATAGLLGVAAWLAGSESGLQAALSLASGASGGRLHIEQARGRLLGPLDIGLLRWQDADLQLAATTLHLDWSPAALLHGTLDVAALDVATLHITKRPNDEPTVVPADLQLPLAVAIAHFGLGELAYNGRPLAGRIAGRLTSDGRQHRVDDLSLQAADVSLAGAASLDGQAPFPLAATLNLQGQLDQRPLAIAATASGPLERFDVGLVATQGVDGHAEATLTPFAAAPFASARLQLDHIDPASWQAGAPQAKLTVVADIVPEGDGIVGSFGLTNHRPGPFDHQRLPLVTVAGALAWHGEQLRLTDVHATLPGGGELTGRGEWQASAVSLELQAARLDARQLVSALHSTRLAGPITATLAGDRQQLHVDLRDPGFSLLADAKLAERHLRLTKLALSAGNARLAAQGELALDAPRQFTAEGELQHFDPSRFGRLPVAQINARLKASGRLAPQPVVDAGFVLVDSRVSGQPVSGQGQLAVAWPRIPKADLELAAGDNRLTARGAYGQAGDLLKLDIDAPQLAPFGLEGSVQGHWELSGTPHSPRLAGTLNAGKLGWPGHGRLNGLSLDAAFGSEPAAPLHIDLSIAQVDSIDQPGLLRAVRIQGDGSNQAHRLTASADVAGKNHLALLAEGGWDSTKTSWNGRLAEARLDSADSARNVRLLAPAPITLAATAWQLGPLRLGGNPLDWQATVQASADERQLAATLGARGSRIGQIDGRLDAAMRGAWSLAGDSRWQGSLSADINDLGWLAEMIGEGWQSEGRLKGELQLAGTPNRPVSSGRLRGDQLALRLPTQGLNLARGELDIDLRDNRLRINRLGFDSLLQPLPRPLRVETRNDLSGLDKTPGRLEVSGEMQLGRDEGQENAWLAVRLERLGAFQLPDQWIAVSGTGRLSWQAGTLGAQGKLAVDAGYWQLAKGGTPRLSDDVVVKRPGKEKPAAALRPRLDLDIATDLGNNFLFNGAGLSSRLDGEVRITAKGRDLPRASGTIRTRSGRFEAYGQKLDIERGVLNFNGLLDNPGLDVRAVRKGLAVEPGVQISGTAQKPVIKLVSDPDLPDAEKLAWLVLGHGSEQMGAGDATTLLSAASGLLGNDSGNVVQQVKKTFGFDELGVRQGSLGDTGGRQQVSRVAGGSVDTTGSTGQQIFSVGKRLSSRALLSYEQTLGRAESIVKLTVNLSRQIAVIGRAGSDNALDVFYTLTFGRKADSDSR
ncbi:translocation/assembly module TamB domain-containing protein [Dechloromonas sp. XY25]|uniref:Translocation/assembly module TamB domain-containing protein n=1 Tax=Dechloromonas hankyongensis TaxID=2908002 RepID=A0ABS9JZF6_9RHOO|nr:translocation/assembly module TamB domain-containing protein [Dechloromonas hankyongensis]MCG2576288.1 translocation/assembly module TamB domain-containing protein [Dechloromonas hankyongensis]